MRETPLFPSPDQADGEQRIDREAAPAQVSRTRAAGRAFLAALASDLTLFGHRLARWFRALAQTASRRQRPRALQRVLVGFAKGCAVLAVLGVALFAGAMVWAVHDLPPEKPVADGNTPSLILEASNGESLGRVGPLRMPDAGRADFPDLLVKAVISIEDRHFYRHWGIDPQGIARALSRNVAAGTIVEGGSTITQQLVKLRILGRERTFARKAREALVAIWIDRHRTKDEILTEYLNSVYLGNGVRSEEHTSELQSPS